jgi:hypothetical protein
MLRTQSPDQLTLLFWYPLSSIDVRLTLDPVDPHGMERSAVLTSLTKTQCHCHRLVGSGDELHTARLRHDHAGDNRQREPSYPHFCFC